jgi:hypothetical protein
VSGKTVAGLTGIIVTLVVGCVAALGLAGGSLAVAACAAPMTASPGSAATADSGWPAVGDWSSSSGFTGCADAEAVLARAMTWLTAWNGGPVPYLSSGDPATWFGGYRRDCSGYASMALGLAGPGLTTAQLAARAAPIRMEALRAGDLLINPAPDLAGHVVIFDHWTDLMMTSYVGFEQAGDGGTRHRTIPYPYFGNYRMSPYRWLT